MDGLDENPQELAKQGCTFTLCEALNYNAANLLSNVNSLHADFKEWIRRNR